MQSVWQKKNKQKTRQSCRHRCTMEKEKNRQRATHNGVVVGTADALVSTQIEI